MPDVQLHLIGGFELTISGSPATLQPVQQRLLAFVALTPRGVDREFAALQLWPDHSEERARASLRSALWRLRRVSAEIVVVSSTHLRLNTHVWVDVRHGLEELARGGDAAGLDGALPFQLLLADLLPDWYDDWLTIERERLRQLSLHFLESRAQKALTDGDAATAIHLSLTAMSIDPLRESPYRLLIEAHLAEGNERDAHRTLDGYRKRLAFDPRLAPSRELEELFWRRGRCANGVDVN
ncbi:transcriptional regulator, SARP family [Rhodococcus rhodochrous ATCC 21198]|nr:BTAD domain-containing putative transcriptional regulator [Rhodococcus aetherivorans]ETT24123.1 transcriptional regulator, SARP family [Rhodococcus rhodochrous ATCC 21198]